MTQSQPKKVAHFVGNFGVGGIEFFVINLMNHSDPRKISFDFIVNSPHASIFDEDISRMGAEKVPLQDSAERGRKFFPMKRYFSLFSLIKKKKYSIIHFHASYSTVLLYCLVAKIAGVKTVILHSHSSGFSNTDSFCRKIICKFVSVFFESAADFLFADSSKAAEWMFSRRIFRKKSFQVIKMGIQAEDFSFSKKVRNEQRKKLGLENSFVIGHVGRFSYAKNHFFLLEIFRQILQSNPESHLMLIGSGELLDSVKERARQLRIEENVSFLGNSCEVPSLMQAMDVFVLPSFSEGLSIVTIEAQAAGLPVFASSNVPNDAKISPLVHFLPLSYSPQEWSSAILNYSTQKRENMCDIVKNSGFDISSVSKELELFYLSH